MTNWFERFQALEFTWRDAIDIAIVAFVLYHIFLLIRGTRAMQMSIGLLLLVAAYFGAQALDLLALETLSARILFYLPFVIIVLFQPEIRRGLASFGKTPLAAWFAPRAGEQHLDAIRTAAVELARKNVGALIAIERSHSLRMYVESGTRIDAQLSAELLMSIFAPNTPLHDGAVIVQGERIAAARAVLPLTSSAAVGQYGTRHRAAVGLSEETDAVVVVVSEENGAVAVAVDGVLHEAVSETGLDRLLREMISHTISGNEPS